MTSAEIFFAHQKWKARAGPNTFRRILEDNVGGRSLASKVIIENLEFVYRVRNRIVHQGFRMSTSSALFCDKAIGTLRYLIQSYSGNHSVANYAYSHGMQLGLLQQILAINHDLDQIERSRATPTDPKKIIKDFDAFEEFMFEALRFTPQDKASIR